MGSEKKLGPNLWVSLFGLWSPVVLHLPVISVVTHWAGAVASRGRKSDGQLNPHTTTGHANPKPANPAFYSSLQIAAKSEVRPKKVQKLPLRYKCGKLVRSGETGVGAPVTPRRTCWPSMVRAARSSSGVLIRRPPPGATVAPRP